MTYDELKTQIADFLNRSDLTSKLDFFIDDLLQVFEHSNFPETTNFVHFSRDLVTNVSNGKVSTFPSWKQILLFFFCEHKK